MASSLIQSRITGNLIFVLLPPFSHRQIFAAYILAAVARGLAVGACVWLVALFFVRLPVAAPLWLLAFAVLSCWIRLADGVRRPSRRGSVAGELFATTSIH